MSHTMIGRDDCSLSLGVVPCAISWLFKLIHRKRDKTWANISVSVSAVEVCGETNAIRDLLSAVDTDSGEENCGPDASLREDPVCGIQLSKQRVLNAPTSERAAFLLDAALTARGGDVPHHSCHMFFNLHIRQQHIGNKSAMKVDQSKLSLIDLGSCVGDKDDSNCGVCLADLGNVITAKLNRHKHVSNRGSKLAMLLQDSLSNTNCATTIIAHISTSPRDVTESLCTMQTVSRIRKQQKKIRTQSSSSSPGGQSSGNERKVNTATKFRFKSTEALDQEISSGGFFAEPEFHPGLEKTSCETVLPMEPSGILNKEVKNRSREVSPVIPSSLRSKLETKKISLMKLCEISPPIACRMKPILKEKTWEDPSTILQDEPNVECLKCNTFAELQNRLGNIDLDETDLYPTKDQAVKILIKPSNSSKSEEKSISAEVQVSRNGEAESARPKNAAKALAGVKSRNAIPDEANPQTLSHLGALRHNAGILSSSPSSGENQQDENMSLTLEDRDIYSDDSAKQPDTRLSPAGKSSPRSTSSSSFSSALSASLVSPLPASVIEEPQSQREMRATITVTVQQPIDLNGQDELVYTVVEEVTINGRHEKGKAKILSVHESRSLQGLAQENQPVRIIGSVGEEPTASFYSSQGNSQTIKNENSNENAPANTTNAHNSEHLDPKDLQQHEAWPDVPLTEDMKDALQEIDVIRTPASKIHEDLLSKQYACEITPNQSWLCQSQNSQNKEMIYKKAEHKHRHLESKQPQIDGPGDCCKDHTPHSQSLKKESTLSRSAAVKQKHLLTRSPSEDSSKLFNAKLKALSGRSQTLDQSKSSWSSAESLERNCSSPILKSRILQESACIDLPHKSLLDRDYFPACSSMSSPGVKEDFHDDLAMCPAIGSPGRVPRFFPIRDMDASDTTWPSKATCLEATGLTKLKPNPRINKASGAHPKNSIVTSKSARRSINRSSSFSPSGACLSQSSWSTQSLSRTQESTRMSGRMDLLRYSRDSLSTLNQSQLDESDELVTQKPFAHTLPSPYSQITAPRDPYHCSGHASDTTSVLSGDLPPAMCKTALLYNRSSVVSSGYESMLRDSEATISSSSTHNSISDHSCSAAAKGTRSLKKRSNMGSSPRRPSQEPGLTLKRSSSGPKVHRVDRNVSDSYEIKVYEIDNVDGLQKRSGAGNKGIVRFSAKLKFLEHRQQRIAEVRAKFTALKRELDVAKQHLMLDPGKWNRKFDLWQTFEVDSLEHLEALEQVTERLQNHLHLCKTHILMVTCFDVADKRRQKFKHRPAVDLKGFVGI